MTAKILIIEDEKTLVKGIKLNLLDEGYEVDWAEDGISGLEKALSTQPDLILLDIMLPHMNGLDVCRNLREKKVTTPIIMLTAKSEEIDKVMGLEFGADDYITKPFSIRELVARIKAHLRRERRKDIKSFAVHRFGDVEIDFTHFRIKRKDKESELTSLEAEILRYLIAHKDEVVTRENLLEKIWGYEKYPTTRTIDNHILKLRKKNRRESGYS